LGCWPEGIEAYQIVLHADPHRDPIRLELGDCLLHLNRLEQALNCFDQCWSDARAAPGSVRKGRGAQLLRRFEEAEIAYERVWRWDGKSEGSAGQLESPMA